MSKPRIPILSFIADAIIGKNNFGKKANEFLPARKTREAVGSVIQGVGDLVPKAQAKDASIIRDAAKAKQILGDIPKDTEQIKKMLNESPDLIAEKLYQAKDLLDDGRLNDSADGLTADTKFKIRIGTSIAIISGVAYQLLAMWFDWPLLPIFKFIGL